VLVSHAALATTRSARRTARCSYTAASLHNPPALPCAALDLPTPAHPHAPHLQKYRYASPSLYEPPYILVPLNRLQALQSGLMSNTGQPAMVPLYTLVRMLPYCTSPSHTRLLGTSKSRSWRKPSIWSCVVGRGGGDQGLVSGCHWRLPAWAERHCRSRTRCSCCCRASPSGTRSTAGGVHAVHAVQAVHVQRSALLMPHLLEALIEGEDDAHVVAALQAAARQACKAARGQHTHQHVQTLKSPMARVSPHGLSEAKCT
jgi:hypothetical protein